MLLPQTSFFPFKTSLTLKDLQCRRILDNSHVGNYVNANLSRDEIEGIFGFVSCHGNNSKEKL